MTRRYFGRSGPTRQEAGDGAARACPLRRGQDRTSPRLPERGTPAHPGQEDLNAAAEESLRRAIAHNEERGKTTHPASLAMLEWLEADRTAQSRIEK